MDEKLMELIAIDDPEIIPWVQYGIFIEPEGDGFIVTFCMN